MHRGPTGWSRRCPAATARHRRPAPACSRIRRVSPASTCDHDGPHHRDGRMHRPHHRADRDDRHRRRHLGVHGNHPLPHQHRHRERRRDRLRRHRGSYRHRRRLHRDVHPGRGPAEVRHRDAVPDVVRHGREHWSPDEEAYCLGSRHRDAGRRRDAGCLLPLVRRRAAEPAGEESRAQPAVGSRTGCCRRAADAAHRAWVHRAPARAGPLAGHQELPGQLRPEPREPLGADAAGAGRRRRGRRRRRGCGGCRGRLGTGGLGTWGRRGGDTATRGRWGRCCCAVGGRWGCLCGR